MSNDYTPRKDEAFALPPVPHNPSGSSLDHTTFERDWTQAERKMISACGHACAEHVRAKLLARIAELGGYSHEWNRQVVELHEEGDRLRAKLAAKDEELEALRAKIDRAEVSYGNMLRADDKRPDGTTEYTRGWGDCLRAIAARKGEGSKG